MSIINKTDCILLVVDEYWSLHYVYIFHLFNFYSALQSSSGHLSYIMYSGGMKQDTDVDSLRHNKTRFNYSFPNLIMIFGADAIHTSIKSFLVIYLHLGISVSIKARLDGMI